VQLFPLHHLTVVRDGIGIRFLPWFTATVWYLLVVLNHTIDRKEVSGSRFHSRSPNNAVAVAGNHEVKMDIVAVVLLVVVRNYALDRRGSVRVGAVVGDCVTESGNEVERKVTVLLLARSQAGMRRTSELVGAVG